MLWLLSTDSLYQGFLKFILVYPYIKFNKFYVPSIILFCISNICCSYHSVPNSFVEKYPGDNAEKGSLKTHYTYVSHRTTLGFPQVHCSCRPCYFPESSLLQAWNNPMPYSHYHWEFSWKTAKHYSFSVNMHYASENIKSNLFTNTTVVLFSTLPDELFK